MPTISAYTLINWDSDEPLVELWIEVQTSFVALDGTVMQAGPACRQRLTCTPDLNAKTLAIPSAVIKATTDAQGFRGGTYRATFYTPAGTSIQAFHGLENFFVAPTDPTKWSDMIVINLLRRSAFFDFKQLFLAQVGRLGWLGRDLVAQEAAPDISGLDWIRTNNTIPITLDSSAFLNPTIGQTLNIIFGDGVTKYHTATGDMQFGLDSVLEIYYTGVRWIIKPAQT